MDERKVFRVCAVIVALYVVGMCVWRYAALFHPLGMDGDQPQAVFQYWRYHVEGAMPPGDLMVDYAFVMHAPPVWWLLMASLSTFVKPIVAAKVLNLVAYFGAAFVMWLIVSKRSNRFIGLCAVVLLIRTLDFSGQIGGGYARSFGPLLVLSFLGAFMLRKHYLALAILVVQAAFYPSVVIPCGIAYGIYVCVAGPTMRDRLRRMGGMFVAGVLVLTLGKLQDLRAPEWWGPLVTEKEALTMPAWKGGGRISEAPLRPIPREAAKNAGRAFRPSGHVVLEPVGALLAEKGHLPTHALVVLGVLACIALYVLKRRRGEPVVDPFPWQVPMLFACAFAAYLLARAVAFKFYLPYRALQHVWPYMFYVAIPLIAWFLAANLIKQRRVAIAAACASSLLPMMLFFGDGLGTGPGGYGLNRSHVKLYDFVEEKLPFDAVFAGQIAVVDKMPLFTGHRAYVTKNLAHPFRPGYYEEAERRLREVYTALYAAKLEDVVAFAQREHVDYLVYDTRMFGSLDRQLFNPLKRDVARVFKANQKLGFVLARPPRAAVVFREGAAVVLDVKRLARVAAPAGAASLPLEQDGVEDRDDDRDDADAEQDAEQDDRDDDEGEP